MNIAPTVSTVGETIRSITPPRIACFFACGRYCRHEQENFSDKTFPNSVIRRLSSNWVLKDVLLAMARPSETYLKEVIADFQSGGIKSIVNLQEIFEHKGCGQIQRSGFSYLPEMFMKSSISYYNFPAPDFGVWNVEFILDILKVIDFATSEGGVAVHCHAGLGRTGAICGCWLIYSRGYTAADAIKCVRKNRPGSIQTKHQISAVENFEIYLSNLFTWPNKKISLEEIYKNHKKLINKQHMRAETQLTAPHFLHILWNEIETIQKNEAEVDENNLIKVKSGKWNCIKCLSTDEIKELLESWLTNQCPAIIDDSENSLLSISTGKMIYKILSKLSYSNDEILQLLTLKTNSNQDLIHLVDV